MSSALLRIVVCALALVAIGSAQAKSEDNDIQLAIDNCVRLIRLCSKPGGEIAMNEGVTEWVMPYFASEACLALIVNGDRHDVAREAAWLKWYADHQLRDGSIDDWETDPKSHALVDDHKRDSVDSYAAAFLQCCDRFRSRYGTLPKGVETAAGRAFDAMFALRQPDGLTWALANYHQKYLEDNAEVYGGAVSAERLFAATRDAARARKAQALVAGEAKALPQFFEPHRRLFSYSKDETGRFLFDPPPAQAFGATTCLANLYAFAWISCADPTPWIYVRSQFLPDEGVAPQCPTERFLIAANRLADPHTLMLFRAETARIGRAFHVADSLGPANYYVNRPAIVVLALLEGADWMPNMVRLQKARAKPKS